MEVRWFFMILLACHLAHADKLNEFDERGKSEESDVYAMLLRYVADNAFKNEPDAYSPKADHYYEDDLEHRSVPQQTDDSLAGAANAKNQDFYYYPVKKGTHGPSYGGSYGSGGGGHHKGKDKDVLWEIVEALGKKKFKFEEALFDWLSDGKGQRPSYAIGGHGGHGDYGPSKGDVFVKVKLLAIASTALLITLGGLILLAPLIVAKGRATHRAIVESAEFNDLTRRVVDAIQNYKFKQ